MELEHPFLKVPCENMVKNFRTSKKAIDKEMEALSQALSKITNAPDFGNPSSSSATAARKWATRLRNLKRKLEEMQREENEVLRRCRVRIEHLRQAPPATPASSSDPPQSAAARAASAWNNTRLQRIIVDYMLREGLYDSAEKLAEDAGIQDLVDVGVFKVSRRVVESLSRRDCSEALKWCAENKRRLAKTNSTLEFRLRIQEFVEVQRSNRLTDAIAYAKKHLAPMAKDNLEEVQRAMALLAFRPDTKCETYRHMYADSRWEELVTLFKEENYHLHGLTRESILEITLKAGISTMKTQYCLDEESRKVNCPTCSEPFNELGTKLPFSHHVHSVLVCSITGQPMNENNPPMVLPNHNVYSENTLVMMAATGNGKIVDPRTGDVYTYPNPKIVKAFIM